MPGPLATHSVTSFTEIETDVWASDVITAEPGINGNEALHTAAFYTDAFAGDLVIQGTLDDQISDNMNWADIDTVTFSGSETEPTPVNFNGVFSHLRFKVTTDPSSTITQILVRN